VWTDQQPDLRIQLEEKKFLLFKPSSLWYFVIEDKEDQYTKLYIKLDRAGVMARGRAPALQSHQKKKKIIHKTR
jgi:hypothetical protein